VANCSGEICKSENGQTDFLWFKKKQKQIEKSLLGNGLDLNDQI